MSRILLVKCLLVVENVSTIDKCLLDGVKKLCVIKTTFDVSGITLVFGYCHCKIFPTTTPARQSKQKPQPFEGQGQMHNIA